MVDDRRSDTEIQRLLRRKEGILPRLFEDFPDSVPATWRYDTKGIFLSVSFTDIKSKGQKKSQKKSLTRLFVGSMILFAQIFRHISLYPFYSHEAMEILSCFRYI